MATMYLMQFFYDEWREGKGKDGKGCSKTLALRLAQERLRNFNGGRRNNYSSNFKEPYYWAPFIIIDDI